MKIVVSNTSHGAYKGFVQEIKNHLDTGMQNVVLAPDRFTAFVERGLISTLELESTFGIEVVSFTRLANKLIGKDIKSCLTPEGSVMLISKVILDVKDQLCYYRNVAKADGFASELYAALTALRNSGATVETLRERAETIEGASSVKSKLLDIALIYDEYLNQLEKEHSDSSTRLVALAKHLQEHPESVAGKHFYCTDIYEFSAPELEILKWIDKYALSLTIAVTSGYDNPNKRIYPDRVIGKLKSICDGKAEIVRHDETLCSPTDAVSRWLFSYSKPKNRAENVDENGNRKVCLRVAKDRYDEILKLATDVVRHVREGGRYNDIEVFVSDLKSYQSDIKSIFSRYKIPFFIDEKELLSEQTKVRYLVSALAVVRSGFRSGEVLDFVKNPLFYNSFDYGEEEVFLFENYVLKHGVEYSKFFSPFQLDKHDDKKTKQHKKEFNYQNLDEKDRFLLENEETAIPERVREKLVRTLAPINFKASVQVATIVLGCRQLLGDVDVEWQKHVAKLDKISNFYTKCAEQVDEKLSAVLDEIEDVIKGQRTVGEFETILSSMLKTLKIALVPTYLDCVFVGSYDSRFMGGKDVYILGAVNGKLPTTETGGIVISPTDEDALSKVGIEVSPSSYQKVMTNMYAVCDLMKKPHGRLLISRPELADGVALQPSVVIKELQSILVENGKAIEEERIDFEHISKESDEQKELALDIFATKRGAYHEILRNAMPVVVEDATLNRIVPEELGIYSAARETIEDESKKKLDDISKRPEKINLAKKAIETTSISRLEKFYSCPYKHYFAYILSLQKRQEGEFLGTENGTILHSVLEQLMCDVRDGKVDETNLEEKTEIYFDNALKECEYEYHLEKPKTKRVLMRVKNESVQLARDVYALSRRSEFIPFLMEAAIGGKDIKPMSIKVGENEIRFNGIVDRIDVKDDDFLIVDYKTYRAKLELKDVYYGNKIQLYVYMKAVKNSLDKRPVGVFYFPIVQGFNNDEDPRYEYQGQFVKEDGVLKSIDSQFELGADRKTTVLPLTDMGKQGKNVYITPEQLDAIGDYALAVATKGEEAIESGFIKPLPIKEACKYCDYQDVCAYASMHERVCGNVSLESFEQNEEDAQND